MTRKMLYVALMVVVLGRIAVAAPITPRLVDELYVKARKHFPSVVKDEPLYGASVYHIVPYKSTFFAVTNHGVRETPHYEVWEYKDRSWRYIFGYDALIEGTAQEQKKQIHQIRMLWARNGFSEAMQKRLLDERSFVFFPALKKHHP